MPALGQRPHEFPLSPPTPVPCWEAGARSWKASTGRFGATGKDEVLPVQGKQVCTRFVPAIFERATIRMIRNGAANAPLSPGLSPRIAERQVIRGERG